ncbi:MAG: hypothetical protein J6J24_03070 [Clostridia bacterium]|nr:hypothetical protein [Clostridia bacterium]
MIQELKRKAETIYDLKRLTITTQCDGHWPEILARYDLNSIETIEFETKAWEFPKQLQDFPNLKTVLVSKEMEWFDLSKLQGCNNIEGIYFDEESYIYFNVKGLQGYNSKTAIIGDLPSSVVNSLNADGWCELLKYLPDLYFQIPSKIFDGKRFEERSVDAVIFGMTERLKTTPREYVEPRKRDDSLTLNLVRYRINEERKKRGAESISGDKDTKMYDAFKREMFDKE